MANGLPPLEKLKKKELPPLNSLKKKGDGTPQPETTSQPTGVITQPLAQGAQQGTQPQFTSWRDVAPPEVQEIQDVTATRKPISLQDKKVEGALKERAFNVISEEINNIEKADKAPDTFEYGKQFLKQRDGVDTQYQPKTKEQSLQEINRQVKDVYPNLQTTTINESGQTVYTDELQNGINALFVSKQNREAESNDKFLATVSRYKEMPSIFKPAMGVVLSVDALAYDIASLATQFVGADELTLYLRNKVEDWNQEKSALQASSGVTLEQQQKGAFATIKEDPIAGLKLLGYQTLDAIPSMAAIILAPEVSVGRTGAIQLSRGAAQQFVTPIASNVYKQALKDAYKTLGTRSNTGITALSGLESRSAYEDAISSGLSREEAIGIAMLKGISVYATEHVFMGAEDMVRNSLVNYGQDAAKNTVKKGMKDYLKEVGEQFSKEGLLEEGTVNLIGQIIDNAAQGKEFDIYSYLDESAVGGLMGAGSVSLKTVLDNTSSLVSTIMTNSELKQKGKVISELRKELENNIDLSQQDKESLKSALITAQKEYDDIRKEQDDLINKFSDEDKQSYIDINRNILSTIDKSRRTDNDVVKNVLNEKLKTLAQEKRAIEEKYASQEEQKTPVVEKMSSKMGEILDTEKTPVVTEEEEKAPEVFEEEIVIPEEEIEKLNYDIARVEDEGTFGDNINQKAYRGSEEGMIKIDPQNENTIIFETNDKIYELGNKDEIGSELLSSQDITLTPPEGVNVVPKTNKTDVVSIDGKEYTVIGRRRDKKGKAVVRVKEVDTGLERRFVGEKAERILKDYNLRQGGKKVDIPDVKKQTEKPVVKTETKEEKRARKVEEKRKLEEMNQQEFDDAVAKSEKEVAEFEKAALDEAVKKAEKNKNKDLVQVNGNVYQVTKKDDGTFSVTKMREDGKLVRITDKAETSKAVAQFKREKTNQEKAALKEAEKMIKDVKKEEQDKILNLLDKLIDSTSSRGRVYDATLALPMFVANSSLKIVRASYKAGKSIAEAIKDGYNYVKSKGYGITEQEYKKYVAQNINKQQQSDTQDKTGIPSKEQKGQEPKQAKPKQEASGEKAETGRDVQTPKEKGRVTPDKTKEEVRVEPDEKEVKEVAEKAGITPKNLKDLYKINRDMFGLNKVKAFANAVVMDRMIGAMAKRAGVSKQEMYGKISFKKGSVAPKGSLKQAASNIWKSTAKEGISKIQQKAATPEQWVKMISDKGGRGTIQELEWIGLQDFLNEYVKENNTKSVPKEVVDQYINDNQIEIVEITKDGKYSQYTLEGGENYREVLLTLPKKKGQEYAEKMRIKYGENLDPMQIYEKMSEQEKETQAKLNNESNIAYKSSHWDESNILAHLRLNERILPNGERVLFIEEVQSDWAQEGKKKGFGKRDKVTENDIEIISDEKEYYDSEMMGYDHRVKFRVKGFDDIDSVTYNDGLNSKERSITDLKKRLANDYNRELLQEGRTPDMPYKKTDQWVGMAMRRAMQMAANEGFDRIAWVTGEQSADRYSLKEKVNSISVAPNESGRFVFIDMKGNYDVTLNVDDNGKIIEDKNNLSGQQSFKGKQLEDVVGKDMADKILSQKEENKFEGQGLEVGGEGMKAFYNSILPKVAKKEAQRFDKKANVEVVYFGDNTRKVVVDVQRDGSIRLVNEGGGFIAEYNKNQFEEAYREADRLNERIDNSQVVGKQLSIAITPEMRMNLNGAVPLFQGEQGAMLAEDGKYIIYALTDPNVSTPLHELAHVFEHYLSEAERTSVLKWAGATEWTTEVSEKFARGFEKFLADGKAPTVSLQKIFNRFKEWLTDIYNGIVGSDIDIQLNDEMRDLYGKMLGVDAVKEQEKKSFANIIRGLKIDTTGKAFDATLGLPVAIYNNAIEITAKAVEAGVEVKKAIQKGIDYANKKMNGKKWDVEGFRNQLLTTIKGQFEQQAAQMRSSKKEVKTPKTRFLGFLTRSGAKIVNANDYIDSMKTNMNLDVSDTKKRIDDAKSKARKVFAKTNKIKNDKEVANIVNDLLNRIISPDEYNMTAQEAIDKIRKDIKNPKVAQELIDAGLDIRTQIDNMTKFMLENAEKFNLSDEAIENLKSNIGNYIHREYMFFSERGKTFRKQSLKTRRLEKWNPTDEMINEAIAEHAIYNGISVDEAKKQIEDLIEDWKKKRTPIKVTGNNVIRIQDVKVEADLMKGRVRIPQNFTLFSEASKEAEKELQKKGIDSENKNYNTLLSVETERIYKDKGGEYVELPPHLRKLLGEERNATQRYINTMLAMSNMVYKAQAMDMIVKSFDGKDGWIYDKEPANNEGDYKLVNDKYSPLNGKWVNIYLIEEFNKLPIYETDLAIAKAYFEYQSLVRTTKTAANPPTNFKNVIGGIFAQMQNGFFIALTNPKLAALSIYSRGHLYFKGRRNELAKQVLKDGAEAGVLSSSVDVEVLGLKGSILSERVKFGKSELGRRYAQQDDWTKSLMVYLYKQDVSLMLFGKKFDDLSKDQQKEVLIKTGSLTKKGVPTFSNLPSWFRTISRLPTGDFISFTVEATRSLIGSGIIAYEHARAASTGVDSKGNTINETQRRAYAKDAAKRIAGLVAIQSVGKAIGAGAFSLGGSAIEYGSQVFAAIFGGGDDEDENDETKLAKIQVVKEINKTIPDWAVGDRVIVTNVDDDGNVTFYNWTGLEPSSETAQLIGGNFKYFEQFYKGSITAKMLIQLYNNENEIGNEIYLEDEPLYKQVFNSAYFLGKNTLLPPFINSTEYEIKRRKEDDKNFGVISQDNTIEENAQSAKELTQVFLSRATIRSYNYNIYNRVKQIAYAQSRHGRVDNLDNIKEEEQIDLRLKNISVIRDAYQICLKHRITTPDSPAKIKKISELNDAVKRNYTDFEEAMIYETDDAKFKEMYDFVMSKSKDIVEYNKLKDERKK